VTECADKHGRLPGWMTSVGTTVFPELDPMVLRDKMRNLLKDKWPGGGGEPYKGMRDDMIANQKKRISELCGKR